MLMERFHGATLTLLSFSAYTCNWQFCNPELFPSPVSMIKECEATHQSDPPLTDMTHLDYRWRQALSI